MGTNEETSGGTLPDAVRPLASELAMHLSEGGLFTIFVSIQAIAALEHTPRR